MAEEQPKESANPAGEVIEEVNEPSMSKEEAIALAEQNTKLVRDCLSKDASSFRIGTHHGATAMNGGALFLLFFFWRGFPAWTVDGVAITWKDHWLRTTAFADDCTAQY